MLLNVRTWMWCGLALALCAAMLGAAGCEDPMRDLTRPSTDLVASFSSIRQEIFEATDAGRTACVTCHTPVGRMPAGGLNLVTDPYGALVNAVSTGKRNMLRVVPGNPEASYLIHKLQGRSGIAGDRMPFSGPPFLTSSEIHVIKRWIEIGAPR
jgi:hypothetical protein